MADEGAAWLTARSDLGVLEVTGADRARLLNGLLTCDVKNLAAGTCVYGYFTSGQGRILADVRIAALADRFLLLLSAPLVARIAEHVARYVIVDLVELAPRPDLTVLGLSGEDRATVVAALAPQHGPSAAITDGGVAALGDGEAVLVAGDLAGLAGWLVLVPAAAAVAWRRALVGAGAAERAPAEHDVARVEAGIPRCGVDFGPGAFGGEGEAEAFPQELGVVDAVSYTKGCYLGQEVVARIHYRGQVNRALVVLELGEREVPPPGTSVLHEGREAGRIGSAVRSPRRGTLALALLHRRAAEAGTEVTLGDGGSGRVVRLPPAGC